MIKYTKEETIKLISGANKQITYYENKIRLERDRLSRIKARCPHVYVENPLVDGVICLTCHNIKEK